MGVLDWVHTVSGRVKDMGQEEERKIPKSVGAKTQPCFTPLFIHGAPGGVLPQILDRGVPRRFVNPNPI